MINNDVFREHIVKVNPDLKTSLLKGLIVLGALLIAGICGFAFLFFPSFASILMLVFVGDVYLAYRLFTMLDIEYEYIVTNGEVDIDKIISKRKRKRLVSFEIKNVSDMGIYDKNKFVGREFKTTINASANDENKDFYVIFDGKKTGNTLLIFTPPLKILEGFKGYIQKTLEIEIFVKGKENLPQ